MKKPAIMGLIFSAAATVLLAWGLAAGETAQLEVKASPEGGNVKVWVDGKPAGTASTLSPGSHVVRVSRQGVTMERTVVLKPGTKATVVADFSKNDLRSGDAKSGAAMQGQTRVTLTSAGSEPPAPAPASPSPTTTPTPAAPKKPEPAKPATPTPKPATATPAAPASKPAETKPPESSAPPQEWSPQPVEGEFGPPAPAKEPAPPAEAASAQPPETAPPAAKPAAAVKPPAPKTVTPKKPAPATTTPTTTPPRSATTAKPKPETAKKPAPEPGATPLEEVLETGEASPYCPAKPTADACVLKAEPGPRGALYAYYCLLVNHDFKKAYELRVKNHDLKWFYEVGRPFCGLHGFEIKGLSVSKDSETQVTAAYTVDLKDVKGNLAETWEMKTILVKEGSYWLIKTTSGKQTYPAPEPEQK